MKCFYSTKIPSTKSDCKQFLRRCRPLLLVHQEGHPQRIKVKEILYNKFHGKRISENVRMTKHWKRKKTQVMRKFCTLFVVLEKLKNKQENRKVVMKLMEMDPIIVTKSKWRSYKYQLQELLYKQLCNFIFVKFVAFIKVIYFIVLQYILYYAFFNIR